MAGDRRKWEAEQNWPKVQAILLEEWDPIGVREVPQAQDEYDAYVGSIATMATDETVTREMMAARLFSIATECIGLKATPWLSERCDQAAAALVGLRTHFGPYPTEDEEA